MTESEILAFIRNKEPHPLHDCAKTNSLEDFMKLQEKESFSEMLFRLIREKNVPEVTVYKAAGITPQHFSKIRSNRKYQPTKGTVVSLAIALGLNLEETKDLMRTAGLAFTHANKTDLVIEYFIINQNGNLMEINETLYSLGLELLG